MDNDILDKFEEPIYSNTKWYIRISLVVIFTLLLYFLLEYYSNKFPENLYKDDQTVIKTAGLIVISILIVNGILISTCLNKIRPLLGKFKAAICAGIILFGIECIFVLFKHKNILFSLSISSVLYYFRAAFFLATIGSTISNIKTHKIRGEKLTFPVILMVVTWLSIAYIAKQI